MTRDELEDDIETDVRAALARLADDFTSAMRHRPDLVAAVFRVSRIRDLWNRQVGRIVTRLRRGAEEAAQEAAGDLGETLPRSFGPELDPYVAETRRLLSGVGDTLADIAARELAAGLNAGESPQELRDRLIAAFNSPDGPAGDSRSRLIATTEATRAWNAGQLAAAKALSGPERPLVKQWVTSMDERVRPAHAAANGQLRLIDEPFDVGGTPMQYPGDPTAPASLTINCRCELKLAAATSSSAQEAGTVDQVSASSSFQSRMPEKLKRYWLAGPGAAKIRWGTPGSFDRCVSALRDDFPQDPEGLCANLYHEATGHWPGQSKASTDAVHTGAMIALVPSEADTARLALDGGEEADQLHVTLLFLGEGADWDGASRDAVVQAVAAHAPTAPVTAKAFGVSLWNPGEKPVMVWSVGDDGPDGPLLEDAHGAAMTALGDAGFACPQQHSPWQPHITGIYSDHPTAMQDMISRLGPVTFDRIRVAFAGEYADIMLQPDDEVEPVDDEETDFPPEMEEPYLWPGTAAWSTPEPTALAFENQQTGDGRLFAEGSLYWTGNGPWPLQYADSMLEGHAGARLAGSIEAMRMTDGRLDASGLLYTKHSAGAESALLLAQGAPLGVSVDLDDVDMELVSTSDNAVPHGVSLASCSVLAAEDGGWNVTGETAIAWTASGASLAGESTRVVFHIGADGTVPADAFQVTAAAGDGDVDGAVLDSQKSGSVIMRITRGRVRGATLVAMPAFADARIVLDDPAMFASAMPSVAEEDLTAASPVAVYDRVVRHGLDSVVPVSAAETAISLKVPVEAVRRHLANAAQNGLLMRIYNGRYGRPNDIYHPAQLPMKASAAESDELTASSTGAVDLPVAGRDVPWDGDAAEASVRAWATDGGTIDWERYGRAFAYRADTGEEPKLGDFKLGYARVSDGRLEIVPRGVFAAEAAVSGARGGVDIPADELNAVKSKLAAVRAHVDQVTGEMVSEQMEASAWSAMKDLPPMPAEWFREPTAEELPPGGAGVNYSNGRIFGWVAQSGEPHAGFAKKITVDGLGRIDTSHFLRQRFQLDDGSAVRAGVLIMNNGHHADGAECETDACAWDDTRTVAGIITVGMNARGMWFSGAAGPWLSTWDSAVFSASQPSYHLVKRGGAWQLRGVLMVPVPGHSSPLTAAVANASRFALMAAATKVQAEEALEIVAAIKAMPVKTESIEPVGQSIDYDVLADAIVASMARAEQRKADEEAELAALLAEASELTASADPGSMGDDTTTERA